MTGREILRGALAGWLAGGPESAACHPICQRLALNGSCDPVPGRPISWDGLALCGRFCRGFAARRPAIVVRRPRRRAATDTAE